MAVAKFIGVYSSTRNPGARAQPAGGARKNYWFAWDDGWGRYRVQLLDAAFQPLDAPRIVTTDEFNQFFTHQPHILVTPVRQLEVSAPEGAIEPESETEQREKKPGKPADDFDRPVTDKAPLRDTGSFGREEYVRPDTEDLEVAENLDRELRAEFALALTRWRRGDTRGSLKTFESMANRREGIIPAHKHMYTDFAVDLRKSQLPTLAKKHYLKAVELAPEDCNAHFNAARIFYETGDTGKALEHLNRALELEPDFEYAIRFKTFIEEKLSARGKSRNKGSGALRRA